MATQEPNVYAGLSVVIGGLMHARPKFFAKVMGELLFWVGEDKMTFGSDYGIWEPKWQVEGFVDWDYPSDEFSDYPRVNTATKKKILGLNAAKLYDIEVPDGVPARRPSAAGRPGRRATRGGRGQGVSPRTTARSRRERGARRARDGARPRTRRADHRPRVRLALPRVGGRRRAGAPAPADVLLRAELRLPHGRRRLRRRQRGAGRPACGGGARRPLRVRPDQRGRRGAGRLRRLVRRRSPKPSSTSCAPTSSARPSWPAPIGSAGRCSPRGAPATELADLTLGEVPRRRPISTGCGRAGPSSGCRPATTRRCSSTRRPGAQVGARPSCRCTSPGPGSPG